eukprot:114680-Chlamydomonas_euryale.AAC.1
MASARPCRTSNLLGLLKFQWSKDFNSAHTHTRRPVQMDDREVYFRAQASIECEAAERRAGRLLHRQQAFTVRSGGGGGRVGSGSGAGGARSGWGSGSGRGRGFSCESSGGGCDDGRLSDGAARQPGRTSRPLSRAHSDLSRRTTDAGLRSDAHSMG